MVRHAADAEVPLLVTPDVVLQFRVDGDKFRIRRGAIGWLSRAQVRQGHAGDRLIAQREPFLLRRFLAQSELRQEPGRFGQGAETLESLPDTAAPSACLRLRTQSRIQPMGS